MNISTISEIDDIITNNTSMQKMAKTSSNIYVLYMQNRSIGEPYYTGPDHLLYYSSVLSKVNSEKFLSWFAPSRYMAGPNIFYYLFT